MAEERVEINTGGTTYSQLLKYINDNMNPDNNAVLLVDDEKGIRKKVARDVKMFAANVQVYEAGNGMEGLEKVKEIRKTHHRDPLLIVLDLNMPIMDGWAFIEEMKKEYEEKGKAYGTPIIVLSSTSGETGMIFKKSVHNGKSGYVPLVTVAKESCVDNSRYDASGEKGLDAWLKHFMK